MCRLVGLAESSFYHAGPGRVDAHEDMALMQRLVRLAGRHPTYGYRRYPNLVGDFKHVDHPEQVWCNDVTYIVLGTGEIVYLAIVMDVFTRAIRGWELGRDLTAELVVNALKRALRRGVPGSITLTRESNTRRRATPRSWSCVASRSA